jgi:hypothetical protein
VDALYVEIASILSVTRIPKESEYAVSRSAREIPKMLADFGERQFSETGADAVEVLRVKAATIRKYWSRLQGIEYLVAVLSSDRVRVYFFNSGAIMLVGENVEFSQYDRIRSKSKLIKKYERPRPPTELELRMEATEDLRNSLTKALRRLARFLGEKEPEFPTIFVTEVEYESQPQNFGMHIDDDGAHLFEERMVSSQLLEGIVLRSSFLAMLDNRLARDDFAQCMANAAASFLLKDKARELWNKRWNAVCKDTPYADIAFFMQFHRSTLGPKGMSLVLHMIQGGGAGTPLSKWIEALEVVHRYHEVSLGTEAWPILQAFFTTLQQPRKLSAKRHVISSIHLAPRALCNTIPTGVKLGVSISSSGHSTDADWLRIGVRSSSENRELVVSENAGSELKTIKYYLDVEDIVPKHGGVMSSGKNLLQWALSIIKTASSSTKAFESEVMFKEGTISEAERAVLERLSLGDLEILSNTLVGSPQRVESLCDSGCLVLVPDFGHIGVEPNLVIEGKIGDYNRGLLDYVVEATIFQTATDFYAVVSAPSMWGREIMQYISSSNLAAWPVTKIHSPRNLVRFENPFSGKQAGWSD